MSTTEGKFEHGGYSLYTKTWTPTGPIKAKMVFVHGFSEHINRYDDFFTSFAAQGVQVFSWDQRGWGRSVAKPAQKGLTGPTAEVVADVAAFVKEKLDEGDAETPLFVMGHSMGGGEIITLAGDTQYRDVVSRVRGWILEAPFIGFTPEEEPSGVTVFMGRLVGKLLPKQQLKRVIPAENLSRDQAVVESVRADELCHDTGTLEGLASLLDRTAALSGGRVNMGKHVRSVFLAHGKDDKICSFDAAMKWLGEQDVKDKTGKPYEGAYHQLHADLCKDEYTGDVVKWILERCGGEGAAVEAKL